MKNQKRHTRRVLDASVMTENRYASLINPGCNFQRGPPNARGILLTKCVLLKTHNEKKKKNKQPQGQGDERKPSAHPALQKTYRGFLGGNAPCVWPFTHFYKLVRSDDAAIYPPKKNQICFHSEGCLSWVLAPLHRTRRSQPVTPFLLGFDQTLGVVCSSPTRSPGPIANAASLYTTTSLCVCVSGGSLV